MKAKTCKQEGCNRPAFSKGWCTWHKPKAEKKPLRTRSPIKKVSGKRAKQEAVYSALRRVFLEQNPNCEICGAPSSEIHHKYHKEGERLNDVRYWMSVDRKCHTWIHANPAHSYEMGYLIKG